MLLDILRLLLFTEFTTGSRRSDNSLSSSIASGWKKNHNQNVELKPTVLLRTRDHHCMYMVLRQTLLYVVFPPCKVSNLTISLGNFSSLLG